MKSLVIMPTYGRIPFLGRALASFLSQTYSDKELVIINDDINIQLKCNYPRVICINLNKKVLVGHKKNIGTNIGDHGLFIPFDDDDIMLPNRISNCVEMHQLYPEFDLYANAKSYSIYGPEFFIVPSGSNTISYTIRGWFAAGGYRHHNSSGEDQEFRNKITKQLIMNDDKLIDYVYNWGGINYHLTYSKIQDIEKIAYDQLVQLNLLNKTYYIEPDYDEYAKFLYLDNQYKNIKKPILIKHGELGEIIIPDC